MKVDIAVIGAMEPEVLGLISEMGKHATECISGIEVHIGKIYNKTVAVARCGIGKVFAALCAELGKQIDIAFHPTDPVLCLRKAEGESGLQVPASGSITSAELNERLLAANIRPPVRFTIAKQGEYWIAVPEAPNIPDTVNVAKPAKRPHKRNPARILQGVTYDDRS